MRSNLTRPLRTAAPEIAPNHQNDDDECEMLVRCLTERQPDSRRARAELCRRLAASLAGKIFVPGTECLPSPEALTVALGTFRRAAATFVEITPQQRRRGLGVLKEGVRNAERGLLFYMQGSEAPDTHLLGLLSRFGGGEPVRHWATRLRCRAWGAAASASVFPYPEAASCPSRGYVPCWNLREPFDQLLTDRYVSVVTTAGRLCLAPAAGTIGGRRVHTGVFGNCLVTVYSQWHIATAKPLFLDLLAQDKDAAKRPPIVTDEEAGLEAGCLERLYPGPWQRIDLAPDLLHVGPYIPKTLVEVTAAIQGLPGSLGASMMLGNDVAAACESLRRANKVSRSVQPANVGIRQDGSAQLLSLGSVETLDPAVPLGAGVLPTWLWPPETVADQTFLYAAEAWTLGVTVLAGASLYPFVGTTLDAHRDELTAYANGYAELREDLLNGCQFARATTSPEPLYRHAILAAARADWMLTRQMLSLLLHPDPNARDPDAFFSWVRQGWIASDGPLRQRVQEIAKTPSGTAMLVQDFGHMLASRTRAPSSGG